MDKPSNAPSKLSIPCAQARSSPAGTCIDIVDLFGSDDEETAAMEPVTSIRKVATPSFPRQGDTNQNSTLRLPAVSPDSTTGRAEETIPVERIYVGMHGYSGTATNPLYVRVDRKVDRCFVLRLSDPFGVWDETEDSTDPGQQVVIEKVPFKEIAKIL
jgi:hypothetical protein